MFKARSGNGLGCANVIGQGVAYPFEDAFLAAFMPPSGFSHRSSSGARSSHYLNDLYAVTIDGIRLPREAYG